MTEYMILQRRPSATQSSALSKRSVNEERAPDAGCVVSFHELDAKQAVELKKDPSTIRMAAKMRTRLLAPTKRGPGTGAGSWGVEAVGALQCKQSGVGVKVAVLDTGIDPNHEAFRGLKLKRKNFTADGDDDVEGHGSHCAGTIFGRAVSGKRIGVATGVDEAIIGKVLDDSGGGTSRAIHEGIAWATAQGAHIISISVGLDLPGETADLINQGWPADIAASAALKSYVENARLFESAYSIAASGVYDTKPLLIAASGNESKREIDQRFCVSASLPATACHLSVAALRRSGSAEYSVADFSNTDVDISAPGVGIISAEAGGDLVEFDGTSMACPHVAGVAALWAEWVKERGDSVEAGVLRSHIIANAQAKVITNYKNGGALDVGRGLVRAPLESP